ncbi:inosine/xanthosine triphosphatase [Gallaecimonas sp. GXIMD4217]|uniref:inosine/xanthosine triphosphatase n=1 Tax=Gallaecimonas sp. GXIMD4217 TaxID=3131927 RepID=UPI00311ADCB1
MQRLKVVVGSQNPVKINAAREALAPLFPHCRLDCEGMAAPSGVAEQPMTARETRLGAENRVSYLRAHAEADLYVAMEGGVDRFDYGPATFAYVVVADKERQSVGRSANLPLPRAVFDALDEGTELGTVMDRLFNTHNIKQRGGAVALLTNGTASRESTYNQALVLAMAPFLNPSLYSD